MGGGWALQDSSLSNRRMPGRGERVKTRDAGRVELESEERAETGKMEIPNSTVFSFPFPGSLWQHAPESGRVLYMGWEASLSVAQSLNLLLPSFSRTEKGSPRGEGGRGGCWKGR